MTHAMSLDPTFRSIDLAPSLDSIRRKHGHRYFASLDAMWEATALWGVTPHSGIINQIGVFTSATVPLALRAGSCRAEARLAQSPNGCWAMGTAYMAGIGGGGYSPSVWSHAAFRSYEEAYAFANIPTNLASDAVASEVYVHVLLERRRQVAVIWSVEDVLGVRPDLTDGQAWEALEHARDHHDSDFGLNWEVLRCTADILFGSAPDTVETKHV